MTDSDETSLDAPEGLWDAPFLVSVTAQESWKTLTLKCVLWARISRIGNYGSGCWAAASSGEQGISCTKLPRALSTSRKNGKIPVEFDAISPWEAMTEMMLEFADPANPWLWVTSAGLKLSSIYFRLGVATWPHNLLPWPNYDPFGTHSHLDPRSSLRTVWKMIQKLYSPKTFMKRHEPWPCFSWFRCFKAWPS